MLIKQEKKGKFLIFENSWTIKLIEIWQELNWFLILSIGESVGLK